MEIANNGCKPPPTASPNKSVRGRQTFCFCGKKSNRKSRKAVFLETAWLFVISFDFSVLENVSIFFVGIREPMTAAATGVCLKADPHRSLEVGRKASHSRQG